MATATTLGNNSIDHAIGQTEQAVDAVLGPPVVSPVEDLLKEITPPQPKVRQQMHVSGINMLGECGIRFMFRYLLGIRTPPNAFLLVGKSCDESVSRNLDNKITTGELLPREEVLGIAEAQFDAEQSSHSIELDVDEKKDGKPIQMVLGEARDKTVALAGLHHDKAAPFFQPIRTRRKFSINMDGFLRARAKALHAQGDAAEDKFGAKTLHAQAASLNAAARDGMDFAGEQDIVEEYLANGQTHLVVRDTKTSGKSPTKSLLDGSATPGIADDSEQLTAYALASHVVDGKLPDLMVLDYLIQTPARHEVKYVPTKTVRDLNDVNVFLNRFANAVHAIRTGTFVPANPTWWGCSERWCGYWNQCPYAKRPKSTLVNIGD